MRIKFSTAAARTAMWLLAITVVAVLFWAQHREANTRTEQFCHLIVATHNDKVKNYHQTIDFLKTPEGRKHNGLNDYIRRVSVPRLRKELIREEELIPNDCKGSLT